jgi:hypothetical protein
MRWYGALAAKAAAKHTQVEDACGGSLTRSLEDMERNREEQRSMMAQSQADSRQRASKCL